jgi:integral membrane protein (TIGR00529 family)
MMVLLKILFVFALLIFLLWRKWPLGLVMLLVSLVLGIIFAVTPINIMKAVWKGATDFYTIYLVAVLYLISILENLLRTGGLLKKMIGSMRVLFRDHRLVASFIPAFIGFLPSAGGAMFSAPLVKEASKHLEHETGRLTFINYWFRHVLETVLPLQPALILAAVLISRPVSDLIFRQWPYTVIAILSGWIVGWKGIKKDHWQELADYKKAWKDIFFTMSPVLFVIITVLLFKFELAYMTAIAVIGLGIGIKVKLKSAPALLWESFKPMTLLLIVGVMIFKEMLQTSGAIAELPKILLASGMPKTAIICGIPLIVGLLTGIGQGYVAVSFPLLIGIYGIPAESLNWYSLAFVSGLCGVMLSPGHLCLALTKEYFQANWTDIYRFLLPATAILLTSAVLLFFIWQ